MKKYNILFFVLLSFTLLGCDSENSYTTIQDNYTIKVGGNIFVIPADYLLDKRQRFNTDDFPESKINRESRDSRYNPHRYVILMGLIPDLNPIENGRNYVRRPPRTPHNVQFNLGYGPNAQQGQINLVNAHNIKPIEEFLALENGWHKIGKNMATKSDILILVKDNKIHNFMQCGTEDIAENPSCSGYLIFNDTINVHVTFSDENFDWYKNYGRKKILSLITSWQH